MIGWKNEIKIGTRVLFIKDTSETKNGREINSKTVWLEQGTEGTVVRIIDGWYEEPDGPVVAWDNCFETCISPDEEGTVWQR